MGGGSKSPAPAPTQTTTTTQVELPDFLQPYATNYISRVQSASNTPSIFAPYAGPRVAPLDPFHQLGIAAGAGQALGGFPGRDAAYGTYAGTVGGQYLSPESNPFIRDTYDAAARGLTDQYTYATQPALTAQAVRNRAMGDASTQQYNDMARWQLGDNLGRLATDIYGQNYQAERARQQAALGLAPQMQGMGYADAEALMGLGDVRRGVAQEQINADILRDFEARQAPLQALDVLGRGIGAASGGGSSITQQGPTYFPSSSARGALGGGLLGLTLGNTLGMGAGGTLGAAGLGAGLGYLL